MEVVKNLDTKRTKTKRPFNGILVGLYSVKDAPDAVYPTVAQLVEPSKVKLIIRNLKTNIDVWNGPIIDLYRFLKRGDRDLSTNIAGTNVERTITGINSDDEAIQIMNIEFPTTYDGEYEIKISTEQGAFPAGMTDNSHVFFEPVWTNEPMITEVIYHQFSLDRRHVNETLGNGIREIIAMDNLFLVGNPGYHAAIEKAQFTATENSAQFDSNLLRTHTALFQEDPTQLNSSELVIHQGELLSNCEINLTMATGLNTWSLIYSKELPNPNADASIMRSDAIYSNSVRNLD